MTSLGRRVEEHILNETLERASALVMPYKGKITKSIRVVNYILGTILIAVLVVAISVGIAF